MARGLPVQLQSALKDFGAGLLEVAIHLLDMLFSGMRLVGLAIYEGAKRTPRLHGFLLVPVSALFWLAIAALSVNIRFAETILPSDAVDVWTINRPASLTILDRNGDLIGRRGIKYADPVPLDELPPYVIDAFIATEDRRFREHMGFDIRGMIRAGLANVRAGSVVEGGSTITQQLAKNLFLTADQTLLRKLEEIQLAWWLEARLGKEEILSLYLNRTYLGAGTYGVEAAAQTYFSKSARDLTLAEAALIAGLPKAPSDLAPTTNMAGAVARSHVVLGNLIEARLIDPVTAKMALAVPPTLRLEEVSADYGYFLDYVQQDLQERFGTLTQDLVVRTTLDPAIQAMAEAAVASGINDAARAKGARDASLIAFDADGGIVAMVGGTDYARSQFNRASQGKRQPGSAFKPFVFLAAMEAGLSPNTLVIDQPISVGKWEPRNYGDRHRGPMRLSTAAAVSSNAVAVQITESIGRDRVIDAARRAGMATALNPVPSLALGALETTLLELTGAYLPFAHHGAETPPHAVISVATREGRPLYAFEPIKGYGLIEPSRADDTARLLIGVMERGTGRQGRVDGHQMGGKTGTTNGWRDAWFVGFSHYYTVGVWVGNDEAEPMDQITGSSIPLTIWASFMRAAHAELPPVPVIEDDPSTSGSTSDVRGFYQSLRADLFGVAYPYAQPDWQSQGVPLAEDNTDFSDRLRRLGRRPAEAPVARVVGQAAPGAAPLEQE